MLDSTVYFVQAGRNGPIKIGVTTVWVEERMKTLQCGNHRELRLVGIICCRGHELEARIHRHFAPSRIRGEWFRPSCDLLDYIAAACDWSEER